MALTKRGETWHTHFFVDGQRFRQSLKTSDWRKAQAAEKKLIAQAEAGKLSASSQAFGKLKFEEAAAKYLLDRLPELAPSSQQKERQLLVKPKDFFRRKRLCEISSEDVLAYRQTRIVAGAGPAIINMEVGVVRRMLKRAKRWALLEDELRPMREPKTIGRALAHEEKLRLLQAAGTNPDWQNARLGMILALCTTMRGIEIKSLRWRDIDLLRKNLTVKHSKTEEGIRAIPMNEDVFGAIMELWERSKAFKGTQPEHFIFPACEHGRIDPNRRMKSWRTAWRKLTQLIQCPACGKAQGPAEVCRDGECGRNLKGLKSPLAGLRFHDLRHHAITELAESQASDSTIMALAGHVSPRMLKLYSHIRQDAKREAVKVLSAKIPKLSRKDGYETNDDTK